MLGLEGRQIEAPSGPTISITDPSVVEGSRKQHTVKLVFLTRRRSSASRYRPFAPRTAPRGRLGYIAGAAS